ncbi:MAG: hypothetical protein V4730_01560 [Pseudomonadota bacterium]
MRALSLLMLTLVLAACATAPAGNSSASSSSNTATATQTQSFVAALEAKRGSALTLAERVQVQGLTGATKVGLNNAQSNFLNKVGAQVGLNGAVIAAMFPEAGKPLSENAVVTRIESSLGKKLTVADQTAVKAAAALRNNSLASLKTGLAASIGSRIGMSTEIVLALMPMLGL